VPLAGVGVVAAGSTGGVTTLFCGDAVGSEGAFGCARPENSRSDSDLSFNAGALGLGGVGPPLRCVRMSSASEASSRWTSTMLMAVPSSKESRTWAGSAGP